MYTRSFRRTAAPVPPPDYSGTALSDAAVPPPAPTAVPEERNEAAEAAFPVPAEESTAQPVRSVPEEKRASPSSGFAQDDWLLLGLIFLFLTGSKDEVKEQTALLIVLGILFFTGRGGFPFPGL